MGRGIDWTAFARQSDYHAERKRRNALREILANSYEPGQAAQEAQLERGSPGTGGDGSYSEPPTDQSEDYSPARAAVAEKLGGINIRNAIAKLAESGDGESAFALQQAIEKKNSWQTVEGPRGSIFQRNTETGELKPVMQAERMPDWKDPSYIAAQQEINKAKQSGRPLSPTAQKELFEADESLQSASNVVGLLSKAKELNKGAMYGPFASTRAKAFSLLPGEDDKANKTIDLDNIMTGQALESLKLIFGGMPTEGERKILLDMQASVDKTPAQRESILNRAVDLAKRRSSFNKSKADALRDGSYFNEGPKISDDTLLNDKAEEPIAPVLKPKATSKRVPKGAKMFKDNQSGREVFTTDGKSYFDAETGKRVE